MKKLNYKKLDKKFKEILKKFDDMSPEELEEIKRKYFPPDTRPIGWISIEDSLPDCMVDDYIKQGYSIYKVKDKKGNEFDTTVCDNLMWYYTVKKMGVTHWWHE
jgi:hypothetical protein